MNTTSSSPSPKRRVAPAALMAVLTVVGLAAVIAFVPAVRVDAEEKVAATVDDVAIKEADVRAFYEARPQWSMVPYESLRERLVQHMVETVLMANAARQDGLEQDPSVTSKLAQAERDILAFVYLERAMDTQITEDKLKDAYQTYLAGFEPAVEVHASHILLATEEDADAVIEALRKGEDFATLARERSTGPSGPNGGDLGYFTRDDMVPPFGDAAFALEPGATTDEPVKTSFGWHVIMVHDRRETKPEPFEQVRDMLRADMNAKVQEDVLESLRAKAKITVKPLDD